MYVLNEYMIIKWIKYIDDHIQFIHKMKIKTSLIFDFALMAIRIEVEREVRRIIAELLDDYSLKFEMNYIVVDPFVQFHFVGSQVSIASKI